MVVVAVGAVLVTGLYRVGFEQQRQRVADVARSRAALLESVATFDSVESADFPGGAAAATMRQLAASEEGFPGLGETGEYTVARLVGDRVVFQLPLRHAPDGALDTVPVASGRAEPSVRALAGDTGTMVGLDYRGAEVLAGYRPLPNLDLGLVAKIDMAEIRAPYVRMTLWAGGVGLVLILAGVAFVGLVGEGLISRLEATEASLTDQRAELEAALGRERLAAEQLRLALKAGKQGVYDFDPRTRLVQVRPEFEEMLGYEAGTLDWTYERWKRDLHPDDRASAVRRLEEYMAGHRPTFEAEFRLKTADGSYRWILSVGEIVEWDDDGSPARFVGTHTDVTDLKKAERKLAAREAHLAEAQGLGVMGSWELVPAQGWTWWSEGLYRVMGMDPDELEPDPEAFIDAIHEEDREAVRDTFDRLLGERHPVEVEFRVEVDGELRLMRGVGRPAEDRDGEDRFLGLVQDITEERRMEEMLRQSQKMEAVGQLSAGMAHDFNNLLTTIMANSDLGLTEVTGDDDAHAALRAELREIHAAARRGRDLIGQIMTFTRDRHLRLREADLTDLLEDMSELLRRTLPESVEVTVETGPEALAARVDPGMIQQIVLNLATNARDAMPDGGRFTLAVDRVDGSVLDHQLGSGPLVRIRARDSGQGMSGDVRERAIEPFFTTKPVGQGTGLGLAMVYGLMQRQAGAVRIGSEVGRGTVVSLFFPEVETPSEPRDDVSMDAIPSWGRGRRILLVEDEPSLRRTARRILERADFQVLEAETGAEAIELLEEEEPAVSLVLTDIVMPRVGGLELHRRCRALGLDQPFLFMSGYSADELDGQDLSEIQHFLRKPWTAQELIQWVGKAMGDEGIRSQEADPGGGSH